MSEQYEVKWTDQAEVDLEEIIQHIADINPDRAIQVLTEIRKKASDLKTFPERGRYVPELKSLGNMTYREIIYRPWRIIYRIDHKCVFVLAVIDARRNLEMLLFEKLIR
jgi:toxin ParE1/3/4